jgi:hypothetical protein
MAAVRIRNGIAHRTRGIGGIGRVAAGSRRRRALHRRSGVVDVDDVFVGIDNRCAAIGGDDLDHHRGCLRSTCSDQRQQRCDETAPEKSCANHKSLRPELSARAAL